MSQRLYLGVCVETTSTRVRTGNQEYHLVWCQLTGRLLSPKVPKHQWFAILDQYAGATEKELWVLL